MRGGRKHFFNENFFDEIDSTSKAYFLGWMFCDGNVKNKYSCKLQLHPKDVQILYLFLNAIEGDREMISLEKNFYPTLYMNSTKFVNSLKILGCVPNKSKKLTPPQIDEKHEKAFWRGAWEADGSLSISDYRYSPKKDGYRAVISFNGTQRMCLGFKGYMNWTNKVFIGAKQTWRSARTLSFYSSSLIDFNLLYDNTNLYLPTKKDRFCEFLSTRRIFEEKDYYKRGRNE